MTGKEIQNFWESKELTGRYNTTNFMNKVKEDVETAKLSFEDADKYEHLGLFDVVAYLGNDLVHEDGKELGRVYTLNIYIPAGARPILWATSAYLAPYLRSFDPGFPYKAVLAFDSNDVLREFNSEVKQIVEVFSTEQSNLLDITCKLDDAGARTARGAYLVGKR